MQALCKQQAGTRHLREVGPTEADRKGRGVGSRGPGVGYGGLLCSPERRKQGDAVLKAQAQHQGRQGQRSRHAGGREGARQDINETTIVSGAKSQNCLKKSERRTKRMR